MLGFKSKQKYITSNYYITTYIIANYITLNTLKAFWFGMRHYHPQVEN